MGKITSVSSSKNIMKGNIKTYIHRLSKQNQLAYLLNLFLDLDLFEQ